MVKNVTKASTATTHKVSICVLLASSHCCTQTAPTYTAAEVGVMFNRESDVIKEIPGYFHNDPVITKILGGQVLTYTII